MTTTLLVDTNRAAYPVYQALVASGHNVSVVGGRSTETLAKLSPNYIPLDYSEAGRLDALVSKKRFDCLVPGCTDLSYTVCAEINRGRYPGIDTPETTQTIVNKEQFRQTATKLGLSVPRVLSVVEAASVEAVIVKPVDAFSGRGIQVLHKPTPIAIEAAIEAARIVSASGRVLLEEFVSGQLHSHSAFIRDGRIVADFFVREDCSASPYAVDTSCVTENVPIEMQRELRVQIENLADGLCLVDGLVHTQFIAQDDRFWIIEVTRRCPGDIYSMLIELSTGYPYAASYAAPFVGRSAQPISLTSPHERIIRHTVTASDGAVLWGLRFNRSVDIRLWVPLATAGDTLAPSPAGRAAIIFFSAASAAEQEVLYSELLAGTLYSFE
ncbi:MAG: ATP-grasp domain-containing protein [Chlorobium sp.]